MTTDIRFTQAANGIWDISLDSNGDITNGDFLDTSLLYALLGERRATESEVPISSSRRGWIGNENKTFENGSKLWLFEQARITRSVLNDIQTTALDALSYLVNDGLAVNVTADAALSNGAVTLTINIFVDQSRVETRFFTLWENTGAGATPSETLLNFTDDTFWVPSLVGRIEWTTSDQTWTGISTIGPFGQRALNVIAAGDKLNWQVGFRPKQLRVVFNTGPNFSSGILGIRLQDSAFNDIAFLDFNISSANQIITQTLNCDFSNGLDISRIIVAPNQGPPMPLDFKVQGIFFIN